MKLTARILTRKLRTHRVHQECQKHGLQKSCGGNYTYTTVPNKDRAVLIWHHRVTVLSVEVDFAIQWDLNKKTSCDRIGPTFGRSFCTSESHTELVSERIYMRVICESDIIVVINFQAWNREPKKCLISTHK